MRHAPSQPRVHKVNPDTMTTQIDSRRLPWPAVAWASLLATAAGAALPPETVTAPAEAVPPPAVRIEAETSPAPPPPTTPSEPQPPSRPNPPPPRLSSGLSAIARMVRSGVETPVVLAYIEASTAVYHLTPSDLVQLAQLGVSSEITSALIKHGAKMRAELAQSSTALFPAGKDAPKPGVTSVAVVPHVPPPIPCPPVAVVHRPPFPPVVPTVLTTPYARSRYALRPVSYLGRHPSAFVRTVYAPGYLAHPTAFGPRFGVPYRSFTVPPLRRDLCYGPWR